MRIRVRLHGVGALRDKLKGWPRLTPLPWHATPQPHGSRAATHDDQQATLDVIGMGDADGDGILWALSRQLPIGMTSTIKAIGSFWEPSSRGAKRRGDLKQSQKEQ